ncbi:MAG: hypothetical protein ACYSWW_09710, partial [Planctomycetota bacterium]
MPTILIANLSSSPTQFHLGLKLALIGFVFPATKRCCIHVTPVCVKRYNRIGRSEIGFVFPNPITQYASRITQHETIGFVFSNFVSQHTAHTTQ